MATLEKVKQFVVTLWDGDIYIIDGYESATELEADFAKADRAEMPNGDVIKTSSISKIQARESYAWQSDQKTRHKRGQHLEGNDWHDIGGLVTSARLESVTGKMIALPAGKSPQARLPGKQ